MFLGIIHRLDRPVSGAVVFARTSKALERMNKLFRDREIEKTYWAITRHKPPHNEETLVHYLKKDTKVNKVQAMMSDNKGGQRSELSYKMIGRVGEFYLLEVNPKTGRPHQIRVQLSKMGCPIFGDVKYGGEKSENRESIYLHSRSVSFEHPVKKEALRVTAKTPKDQIWRLFDGVS